MARPAEPQLVDTMLQVVGQALGLPLFMALFTFLGERTRQQLGGGRGGNGVAMAGEHAIQGEETRVPHGPLPWPLWKPEIKAQTLSPFCRCVQAWQ